MNQPQRAWITVLVGLALTWAGCADKSGPAASTGPPASVPDVSGSIVGLVVDDEQLPVPNVAVTLLDTGASTRTDGGGAFGFNFVPPGPHRVEARWGALEPVYADVTVEADATAQLTIQITAPVELQPYHVLSIEEGYFGCHAAGMTCPAVPNPNERTRFDVPYAADLAAVLLEVTWDASVTAPCVPWDVPPPGNLLDSTPCLDDLHAWAYYQDEAVPRGDALGRPPYLRLPLASTALLGVAEEGLRIEVLTEFAGINHYNPGVAFEQPFMAYLTTFHLVDASANYTGVPSTSA